MKVKIKKLHKDAIIPTYATNGSAAVDLYAIEDYMVCDKVKFIRTGLAIEMPPGYYAEVYNRSGMAAKRDIIIRSSRVIDNDYKGELLIPMKADISPLDQGRGRGVFKGDRVAQMIIKKYEKIEFEEVDELQETDRGSGGFGSTGD